ncbi:hypothetical protein Drorol1_Dr00028229 [Drosera rotundifolia]
MDKMIQTASSEVIITNDGTTFLNKMEVLQPAAKMLVELSKSQLRFRLSKLYSAKGLSLKADALRSRTASIDIDDDLVSSSSRLVVDDSLLLVEEAVWIMRMQKLGCLVTLIGRGMVRREILRASMV